VLEFLNAQDVNGGLSMLKCSKCGKDIKDINHACCWCNAGIKYLLCSECFNEVLLKTFGDSLSPDVKEWMFGKGVDTNGEKKICP